MNVFQQFYCLEFHQNEIFNQHVGKKLTNYNPIILNFDGILVTRPQSCFTDFNDSRIFINLFEKAASQGVANFINTADDLFRNLI